ncbi:hypothetical protein AXXA_00530 [Achromobacter insuavis AXX-A]|uniref:Uncharacterized protein n=1 Tax=Achromobacter insuavis AXX-A TaxID=1003200 RepID=F7STX4_9BURK|nr:hypothetical protein AXXA_00530 [Achromobacter insuavis AXX-A]
MRALQRARPLDVQPIRAGLAGAAGAGGAAEQAIAVIAQRVARFLWPDHADRSRAGRKHPHRAVMRAEDGKKGRHAGR